MKEYPKIQSIYKRYTEGSGKGKFNGAWSRPEFEYLAPLEWEWSEKINGTNCRVHWSADTGEPESMMSVRIGGRTDRAQMPIFLYERLQELFPVDKFTATHPGTAMTLYGEGIGRGIQRGGSNYKSDGVDFVLFDVLIDGWWLRRPDVEDIADTLDIDIVPIVGTGPIQDAIDLTAGGITSRWGSFQAEGLVLKPTVELQNRDGRRIITKMKTADFLE